MLNPDVARSDLLEEKDRLQEKCATVMSDFCMRHGRKIANQAAGEIRKAFNRGYELGYADGQTVLTSDPGAEQEKVDNLPEESESQPDAGEAYNRGLNDAWNLARRIFLSKSDYDKAYDINDLRRVFKFEYFADVIKLPIEDAMQLAAEDKENFEIGDEVIFDDDCAGIITKFIDCYVYLITSDGDMACRSTKYIRKTGRKIDIKSIIDSIGKGQT